MSHNVIKPPSVLSRLNPYPTVIVVREPNLPLPHQHICILTAVDVWIHSIACWKEQSAQQLGAVWTTGNHLPVVYTSYRELKASNEERPVVLVLFKASATT